MADDAQFSEVLEITVDPSSFTDGLAQIERAYDDFVERISKKGYGGSSVFDVGSLSTITEGIKAIQGALEDMTAAFLSNAAAMSSAYDEAFSGVADKAKETAKVVATAAKDAAEESATSTVDAMEAANRYIAALTADRVALLRDADDMQQRAAMATLKADILARQEASRVSIDASLKEADAFKAAQEANVQAASDAAQAIEAIYQRFTTPGEQPFGAGTQMGYFEELAASMDLASKKVEDALKVREKTNAKINEQSNKEADQIAAQQRRIIGAAIDEGTLNNPLVAEESPHGFFGGFKSGLAGGGDLTPAGIGELLGWVLKFNAAWKLVNIGISAATLPLREFGRWMKESWEYSEKLAQSAADLQMVLAQDVYTQGPISARVNMASSVAPAVVERLQMVAAQHGFNEQEFISSYQNFVANGGAALTKNIGEQIQAVLDLNLALRAGTANSMDFRRGQRDIGNLLAGTVSKNSPILHLLGLNQVTAPEFVQSALQNRSFLPMIEQRLGPEIAAGSSMGHTPENIMHAVHLRMMQEGAAVIAPAFRVFYEWMQKFLDLLNKNPQGLEAMSQSFTTVIRAIIGSLHDLLSMLRDVSGDSSGMQFITHSFEALAGSVDYFAESFRAGFQSVDDFFKLSAGWVQFIGGATINPIGTAESLLHGTNHGLNEAMSAVSDLVHAGPQRRFLQRMANDTAAIYFPSNTTTDIFNQNLTGGSPPPPPATVATNAATAALTDYKRKLAQTQATTEAYLLMQHQQYAAGKITPYQYQTNIANAMTQEGLTVGNEINAAETTLRGLHGLAPQTLQKYINGLETQRATLEKSRMGTTGAASQLATTANTQILNNVYETTQRVLNERYTAMARVHEANATTAAGRIQIQLEILRHHAAMAYNIYEHQAKAFAPGSKEGVLLADRYWEQSTQLQGQMKVLQAGLIPAQAQDLATAMSNQVSVANQHVAAAQTELLRAQLGGDPYAIQNAHIGVLGARVNAARSALNASEQILGFDQTNLGKGINQAQLNQARNAQAAAMDNLTQATMRLNDAMANAALSFPTIVHDVMHGNFGALAHSLSWSSLTNGKGMLSTSGQMQSAFGKVYGDVTGVASAFHNQGVGAGIGATVSAIGSMLPGPYGAVLTGVGDMISAISGMFTSASRHIAQNIHSEFVITQNQLNADQINLATALTQTEKERTQAIQQLSGQKGGGQQLSKLLPQFDQTIAAMKLEIKKTTDNFQRSVMEGALNGVYGSTELSSFAQKWSQINDSVEQYLNAVGTSTQSLAEANTYVSEMLQQIQAQDQQQLLQGEQQAIQNAQQLNSLLLQRVQLQEQERAQVFGIQNADAIERNLAPAVRVGQQLAMVQQQFNQQMLQLNAQIQLKTQEVALQQKVFNIATDTMSLYKEANQVALDMMNAQVEKWQQIKTIVDGIQKGANGQYQLSSSLGGLVVPIGNLNPSEFTPFSNNGTINITVTVPAGSDGQVIGQSVAAALQQQAHHGMTTYGLPNAQGR